MGAETAVEVKVGVCVCIIFIIYIYIDNRKSKKESVCVKFTSKQHKVTESEQKKGVRETLKVNLMTQ